MEFCNQAWSPSVVRDIQVLEKVQQRATKWVKHELHWETEAIKPDHLGKKKEKRRYETYKINTGKEDIESESLFTVADALLITFIIYEATNYSASC